MNAGDFILEVLTNLEHQGVGPDERRQVSGVLMNSPPALLRADREACRRLAVDRMVLWTEADDMRSQDFRDGIERGCSDVARAIYARGK